MQRSTIVIRSALLATVLAGLACARNNTSDQDVGAARDSSTTAVTDTARTSGIDTSTTDSARMSRLDSSMTDTARAVSPQADTMKSAVDSVTTAKPGVDSSTTAR